MQQLLIIIILLVILSGLFLHILFTNNMNNMNYSYITSQT